MLFLWLLLRNYVLIFNKLSAYIYWINCKAFSRKLQLYNSRNTSSYYICHKSQRNAGKHSIKKNVISTESLCHSIKKLSIFIGELIVTKSTFFVFFIHLFCSPLDKSDFPKLCLVGEYKGENDGGTSSLTPPATSRQFRPSPCCQNS